MGYYHLALAAALEDKESLSTLYIIYMKLAEIHANYMPDAELCKNYTDRAQSLRRELAGDTEETHQDLDETASDTHTNAGQSDSSSGTSTLTESSMTDTGHTIDALKESNLSHKEDTGTNILETDSGPADNINPETTCPDKKHIHERRMKEGLTIML